MSEQLKFHATLVETNGRAQLVVLCKQHYSYQPGRSQLKPQAEFYQPMVEDFEYETHPEQNGRLLRHGNDLWPRKIGCDVIVQGEAVAPNATPCQRMLVHLRVGERLKSIAVFGTRYAERRQGQLHFTEPEPFERMSLDWWNAYGGVDPFHVPKSLDDTPLLMGQPIVELFPGAYPRNPMGKGYWVQRNNFIDGLELPNLEDPDNLLQPASYFVEDPRNWWRAPQPANFGWTSAMSFPRSLHMGTRPYYLPKPEQFDELAELQEGRIDRKQLQPGLAELTLSHAMTTAASRGMCFSQLDAGTLIEIAGMHVQDEMRFRLPGQTPQLTATDTRDNSQLGAQAKLHTLHVLPNDNEVRLVWAMTVELSEAETEQIAKGVTVDELAARYQLILDGTKLERAHWPEERNLED